MFFASNSAHFKFILCYLLVLNCIFMMIKKSISLFMLNTPNDLVLIDGPDGHLAVNVVPVVYQIGA